MGRYRLLHGMHQQRAKNGEGSETFKASERGKNIVESDIDLEKLHGSEKFQSLDRLGAGEDSDALQARIAELEAENARLRNEYEGNGEVESDEVVLSSMTVDELYDFGKEQGIELPKGMKKQQLVDTIGEALA